MGADRCLAGVAFLRPVASVVSSAQARRGILSPFYALRLRTPA